MRQRWPGLAAVYVGAVVGAGFASGREILHFFALAGRHGLVGAAVAGVLFAVVGALVLHRLVTDGHQHHGALLRSVCGPVLGAALDGLASPFLFIALAVVIAGAGALGHEYMGWPRAAGIGAMAVALAVGLARGRAGLALANALAVPLIIVACAAAALGARGHLAAVPAAAGAPGLPWGIAAVLYVAYNLILGLAGLCAATDGRETTADAIWGGVVGGLVLGGLCCLLTLAFLPQLGTLVTTELPFAMVLPPGVWRSLVYPAMVFAALWTTGAAATAALGARLGARHRLGPLLPLAAAPLAGLGLVKIVGVVYPVMGYGGLPLLAALLWQGLGARAWLASASWPATLTREGRGHCRPR